jgi:hypothetical protein
LRQTINSFVFNQFNYLKDVFQSYITYNLYLMKIFLHLSAITMALVYLSGCRSTRVLPAQIFSSENYCQVLSPATTQYDSLLAIQIRKILLFLWSAEQIYPTCP